MKYQLILISFFFLEFLRAQVTPLHTAVNVDTRQQSIQAIAQDEQGRLLLGTSRGITRFNGFKSKHLSRRNGRQAAIKRIVQVNAKVLAMAETGELYTIYNDTIIPIAAALNEKWVDLKVLDGKTYAFTKNAVFEVATQPFSFTKITELPFEVDPQLTWRSWGLLKGEWWCVVGNELMNCTKGESRSIPSKSAVFLGIEDNKITLVPQRMDLSPILYYQGGQFIQRGKIPGLKGTWVRRVVSDRMGIIVFTENGFFTRENRKSEWKHWFKTSEISVFYRDPLNGVWMANSNRILLNIPNGNHVLLSQTPINLIEKGPNNSLLTSTINGVILQVDKTGKLLSAWRSENDFADVSWMSYTNNSPFITFRYGLLSVNKLVQEVKWNQQQPIYTATLNGKTYMGKEQGLFIWRAKKGKRWYDELNEQDAWLPVDDAPVRGIFTSDSAGIVITEKGVFTIDLNEQLMEIKHKNQHIEGKLAVQDGDVLFVCSFANDIFKLADGRIQKVIKLPASLRKGSVSRMLIDGKFMYLLTDNGLFRSDKNQSSFRAFQSISGFEGLNILDITVQNDRIYMATQKGLIKCTWDQPKKQDPILALGKPYSKENEPKLKEGRLEFGASTAHIGIPMECVDLSGNKQLILQYRINEDDEKSVWNSYPVTSEQITFSHLSPGNYTVECRLLDASYAPVSEMKTVRFSIASNGMTNSLFWFISGIAVTIATAIGVRYFEKKKTIERLSHE